MSPCARKCVNALLLCLSSAAQRCCASTTSPKQTFNDEPGAYWVSAQSLPVKSKKAAVGLVSAALKHKTTSLADLRELVVAISADAFQSVIDEVNTKTVVGLVKKYDRAESARAVEDPAWARAHFVALAVGEAQPTIVAKERKRSRNPRATGQPKTVRTLHQSRAMTARNKTSNDE